MTIEKLEDLLNLLEIYIKEYGSHPFLTDVSNMIEDSIVNYEA